MATVSEVRWYKTKEEGICPYCNRKRPLGRVNVIDDSDVDRCIDCCFGPPMEFWMPCPKCGSLEVNPEAYCYQCEKVGEQDGRR